MKKIFFIMAITLLAVTLVACSSQADDFSAIDDANDAQQASQEEAEQPVSDKEEFASLLDKANELEYIVTYDLDQTQSTSQDAQFTMYVKGEDFRMDYQAMQQGTQTHSSFFLTSDGFVMCTQNEQWSCFTMPQDDAEDSMPAPDLTDSLSSVEDNFEALSGFNKVEDRTIAQTTAHCYDLSTDGISKEICLSEQGVLLYFSMQATGVETTYEALSYETTVDESAFDLPAEPQDFASMMQG